MEITIIILTRDRPAYFMQALESVINQKTTKNYQIIVSDNSEGDETQDLIKYYYPNIKYIRRSPTLASEDHFREAFKIGSKSDFFALFHDDDIMLPTYVEVMSDLLLKNNVVAVGCNAQYINDKERVGRYFLAGLDNVRFINNQLELVKSYFQIGTFGHAPFPGYMYSRNYYRNDDVNKFEVGKYSDFTFLLKLLSRGKILWTTEVLMLYRVHGNNDSGTEDIHKRLSLVRYIYSNGILKRGNPIVFDIKFRYWSSSINSLKSIQRSKIVWKFLVLRSLFYLFTNHRFFNEIFKKIIIKWKR